MTKADPTGCCTATRYTARSQCSALTLACVRRPAGNMTGMVGTALYVSPEVQGNTKATYNQVGTFLYLNLNVI